MRLQIDTFPIKDGKTSSIVSNQLCLETLGFHNFHHDEVFGKIYICRSFLQVFSSRTI